MLMVVRAALTLEDQGKARMEVWKQWNGGSLPLGIPGIEPFARLVTPTPSDIPIGPMPPDVEVTDRAVCMLRGRLDSILWRALEQYHLRDDAAEVKWARLGKTRSGFYRLVDRAHRKLMEFVFEILARR